MAVISRSNFLLCNGVWVLNAIIVNAQSLPQNSTQQQVIGYRMQQQNMECATVAQKFCVV